MFWCVKKKFPPTKSLFKYRSALQQHTETTEVIKDIQPVSVGE